MTHNQIDYLNLVENRRHNRASESLTGQDVAIRGGTLGELERHNIATENIGYANIAQADAASQRAASVARYSSELSNAASRYAADTNAAAQRYNAQLSAETQRYNVDAQTSAQRYATNANLIGQIYSANKQSENVEKQVAATVRGQDVSVYNTGLNNFVDLAKTLYQTQTGQMSDISRIKIPKFDVIFNH